MKKIFTLSLLLFVSQAFSNSLTLPLQVKHRNLVFHWDANSPWFFDFDGNGVIDINDKVSDLIGSEVNVFFKNSYGILPTWLLTPIINPITYKDYCPQFHKNSDSSLINSLKKIISVPTEAVYLAKNQADEKIILPKSIISRIWFYQDSNGSRILPNSDGELATNDLMFFWPANGKNILKKYKNQKLFRLVRNSSSFSFDNKIGCLPLQKR